MFFCFSVVSLAIADNFDARLNDLQRQINQLKAQKNISSVNLPFTINGRVAVLGNFYSNKSDNADYKNNLDLRNAVLSISKDINNFRFKIRLDYNGDDGLSISDAYLAYNINDNSSITIGQQIYSNFMENEKHSNAIAVSTYSPYLNWLPGYLIGVSYSYSNENFGFFSGIYGNAANETDKKENTSPLTIASRIYFSPINDGTTVIHIGADGMYRYFHEDQKINDDDRKVMYHYGFELAFQYNNILMENEFINLFTKYNNLAGMGNEFYSAFGFSNQLVIGLTGEKRKYVSGTFDFPEVINPINKNGYGAWEIAFKFARWNGKDTNDNFVDNIGTGYEITAGLNWFPINEVMILFNYSRNQKSLENYFGLYSGYSSDSIKYDVYRIEARMQF